MKLQLLNNEINSSTTKNEDYPYTITNSDHLEKKIRFNQRSLIRGRSKPTCFEWIQLIATICIPIIISIYSFVENNSSSTIAAESRHKDMFIANASRMSDREIALANRLNELEIAEQIRQKDRELASDQQQQNVLLTYQMFLAKLVRNYGVNSSTKPEAKRAAYFLTMTVLSQLDTKRRSIVLRYLYDAKFIHVEGRRSLYTSSSMRVLQADFTNIIFGTSTSPTQLYTPYRPIRWDYLWLAETILTNSSFRETLLNCAMFYRTILDFADFSFARHDFHSCVDPPQQDQTDFSLALLVNASLYKVDFRFTDFYAADLSYANMYGFRCIDCHFMYTILFRTDLSFSEIYTNFVLSPERVVFINANVSQAILHSAHYRSINFDDTVWSNAQATQILIYNCTFTNATMNDCSLMKSSIEITIFKNANLFMVDLSDATLRNVTFINSNMSHTNLSSIQCEYCHFINVTLQEALFENASFRYSRFFAYDVDLNRLVEEATDLSGSILSNGTLVINYD